MLVIGSLFVLFRLSNKVSEPVKTLVEFAEQVGAGDFSARLSEGGDDDFGYIAAHLNRRRKRPPRRCRTKRRSAICSAR